MLVDGSGVFDDREQPCYEHAAGPRGCTLTTLWMVRGILYIFSFPRPTPQAAHARRHASTRNVPARRGRFTGRFERLCVDQSGC